MIFCLLIFFLPELTFSAEIIRQRYQYLFAHSISLNYQNAHKHVSCPENKLLCHKLRLFISFTSKTLGRTVHRPHCLPDFNDN